MSRLVIKINAVLKDYFERRDINLVDFKVTFGRSHNKLMLADEILPDNCHLWDLKNVDSPDHKNLSLEQGNADDAYNEIFHRVTGE
jgi:phosphoribosylaminoimidazole-succinocarboxamide synthase